MGYIQQNAVFDSKEELLKDYVKGDELEHGHSA
jgi:hypothetical protein